MQNFSRRAFLKISALLIFLFIKPLAFAAKKVALPLDKLSELKEPGDGIILKIKEKNYILIKKGEKQYLTIDGTCTHQKCNVDFKKEWKEIRCSCHGSKYTLEGKVLNGPSTTDLTVVDSVVDKERLIITIEK